MILYNLKSVAPGHWAIAKFDADFNVAAIYNLIEKGHSYTCDCPANNRSVVTKPCKHKRMMPFMLGAANTPRFFDPEAGRWHEPLLGEAVESPEPTTEEFTNLLALEQAADKRNVSEASEFDIRDMRDGLEAFALPEGQEAYGKPDTTYLEAAREINKFERQAIERMAQQQPAATPASARQAQAGEGAIVESPPPLPTSGGLRRR